MIRSATAFATAALLACAIAACETKTSTSEGSPPPPPSRAAPLASAAPTAKPVEYGENDFVENDRNRDPFRSYATLFVPLERDKRPLTTQREVLLAKYSVDELRLVAIVQASDYPRAMVVDPQGRGWVIKKGDFICRPESVHTGGSNGADYQLNWRVDQVRDGELVLIREDPANPTATGVKRVIPLHPEAESTVSGTN